ncbi:MAG: macro domain-containing protein [Proteobacteria bacterium]|nr:macro domain-containing protein [Pseudomonadota bacterium]
MTVSMEIVEADITTLDVDAIVNAANEQLLPGGGVCGAIHAAAGPDLAQECRRLGGCPTGEARITAGYNLTARHVIHAVGPVWHGGGRNEAALLASAYQACYQMADAAGLSSIAFPAISTGIFGYPLGAATGIALGAAQIYQAAPGSLRHIVFCCFGAVAIKTYRDIHHQLFF